MRGLLLLLLAAAAPAQDKAGELVGDSSAGLKAVDDMLNGFLADKPPKAEPAPARPSGPVAAPPPVAPPASPAVRGIAQKVARLEPAQRKAVFQAVVHQVEHARSESERRQLVQVGAATGRMMDVDNRLSNHEFKTGPAYAQLEKSNATVAQGGAQAESARAFARAAFESGLRSGDAPSSTGTPFFQRAGDRSPYHHPPPDPRQRGLRTREPPPPTVPLPAPGSPKGVLIRFEPAAIAAATTTLEPVEDMLLDADDSAAAAQAIARRLAALVAGDLKETPIDGLATVSLAGMGDTQPLRRIHGYVVRGDDLVLIGSTAGPGRPLAVDEIVVGLRAAWRDDTTPYCSLEPEPGHMGGPQRAVVTGVERATAFAKTMLDADYEMKRLLFGDTPAGVPGFVTLKDAVAAALGTPGRENPRARFWFTPVQPQAGEIRTTPDRTMAIFSARVQVKTQAMVVRGGRLVDVGAPPPHLAAPTRFLSEHFAAFKRTTEHFAPLHGLFDVVLLGAVLKHAGVDVSALRRFVARPVRTVDVPETYRGLTALVEVEGHRLPLLRGGVAMDVALDPGAVVAVDDPRMAAFRDGAGDALAFALGPAAARDDSRERAGRFLAEGRPLAAAHVLTRRLADRPTDVGARVARAGAYAAAGLHRLADRDLVAAGRFSGRPYRLRRLQLLLAREGDAAAATLDEETRTRLGAQAFALAVRLLGAGAPEPARAALERARALGVTRPEARGLLASILEAAGDRDGARREIDAALAASPDHVTLLKARAALRLGRHEWAPAIADADALIRVAPRDPDGYVLRAVARLGADQMATDAAHVDLKRALQLAPDHARAHGFMAMVLRLEGDIAGARAACENAIRLAPGDAQPYLMRMEMRDPAAHSTGDGGWELSGPARVDPVLADLNTALGLDPANFTGRLARGRLLQIAAGTLASRHLRHTGVMAQLARAVGEHPRARRALRDGHLAEAVRLAARADLELAARHAPHDEARGLVLGHLKGKD